MKSIARSARAWDGWPYLLQAGIGVALILRAVFWMPSHHVLHVVLAVAR